MKTLKKAAQAGTVESADILITVAPAESGVGIQVNLKSPTLKQYGRKMIALIEASVKAQGVEDAVIDATDKGALDYTIEARTKTAVLRALN